MAVDQQKIEAFVSGVHNRISNELIPKDAASESLGWLTKDGRVELMYGRQAVGAEGASGAVLGEHFGYKTDGTSVHFRKIWDGTEGKVQYLNGSTWTDVITGLANADVTFTNYASLAGNFVYMGSPEDGIFKIVTANPGDYSDVYDSTKNFKGYFFIDKGRAIMWNVKDDATGLYGSYIDSQDSDVYTTVSGESIGSSGSTNYTGTLAFRSGNATRTCFGVTFTDGTQTITIDFTGTATSDSDGSGTVNFTTGAYNITFDASTTGAVTSDYQWEDSNAKGVTDFSKSATRVAGEGFVVRQDAGGDAIQVVVPYEGSYFSMKEHSVYQFTLDVDDTNPTNELIRTNIGVSSLRAATGTSRGIVFVNTGNPSQPVMSILERNVTGDNFTAAELFPHFDFSLFDFSDVVVGSWDRYVVVGCKKDTDDNNRLLLCDMREKTIDIAPYSLRTVATDGGVLYGGDPLAQTVYEMFTGFDDMGTVISNEWISAGATFGSDVLKKVKRYRFQGQIAPDQSIKVYIERDDGDWQWVGTILGSGDYVDYNSTYAIGTTFIGQDTVGGGDTTTVYKFLMELKVRLSKFRKRRVKFVAQGYGYCAIRSMTDYDIWTYQHKLPKNYRLKQNVSLDGATTDEDSPSY